MKTFRAGNKFKSDVHFLVHLISRNRLENHLENWIFERKITPTPLRCYFLTYFNVPCKILLTFLLQVVLQRANLRTEDEEKEDDGQMFQLQLAQLVGVAVLLCAM